MACRLSSPNDWMIRLEWGDRPWGQVHPTAGGLSAASRRGLFVPQVNSACVLLRITKRFRASLPDVYAWCTEFRDSDPELSRVRLRTRHVLRREGTLIEVEETGTMGFPFAARFLVRLRPPDGWEADARSNMGHTHNTYRLFSDTEGTRLEMTFDVRLTGPYRLFAPFARGFVLRRISQEWDDYVRAMESGR